MNSRLALSLGGLVILGGLVVGISRLSAQREQPAFRPFIGQPGRFVVAHATATEVLVLDSASGQIYKIGAGQFKSHKDLPQPGQPGILRRPGGEDGGRPPIRREGDKERPGGDKVRREGDKERPGGELPRRKGDKDRPRGSEERPGAEKPRREGDRREGDERRRENGE